MKFKAESNRNIITQNKKIETVVKIDFVFCHEYMVK